MVDAQIDFVAYLNQFYSSKTNNFGNMQISNECVQ